MRSLLVMALVAVSSTVSAQVEPWEQHGKRIEASQQVGALTHELMGDSVSMMNGALSFSVTDVSIPGNSGLPVAFSRSFQARLGADYPNDLMLADWDIDVPHISGNFAPDWRVRNPTGGTTSQARCSGPTNPLMPDVPPPGQAIDISHMYDFWQGNHINIPGVGSGEMLLMGAGAVPQDGNVYRWTTNDQIRIYCITKIKNGDGAAVNEGFTAVTPDGTRYTFDYMAQYAEPTLSYSYQSVSGARHTILRPVRRNVLYATKVEDRFGNSVHYTYTNQWNQPARLTTIWGSDGREINIAYAGPRISTVTAKTAGGIATQRWTYEYQSTGSVSTLHKVKLPDASEWEIDFGAISHTKAVYHANQDPQNCYTVRVPQALTPSISVKHPSGALASFQLRLAEHGRSNVVLTCNNVRVIPDVPPDASDDSPIHPIGYYALTIASKTLTGAGLQPSTWTYTSGSLISFDFFGGATRAHPVCSLPGNGCYVAQCTDSSCAGRSGVRVTGPDGRWVRHSYGNSFLYDEGKLLEVDYGYGEHIERSVVSDYDLSLLDTSYPAFFGASPRPGVEGFQSDYHRPLVRRTTRQRQSEFIYEVEQADIYARPTRVRRESSLDGAPSKIELTEYHDNAVHWVLGQISKVTTNGKVSSETTYNGFALPQTEKAFGRPIRTMSYDALGNLHTVTDGNARTTTLTNWKRGLPGRIEFPASTSPAGAPVLIDVNDMGWVTGVTDELSRKTTYGYDAMGRASRVDHPVPASGPAWYPTTYTFQKLTQPIDGISIGHWRHTSVAGNLEKVAYLDALWRPVLTKERDTADATTTRFVKKVFDGDGNTVFESYPSTSPSAAKGAWSEYKDALGRMTSHTIDSDDNTTLSTLYRYLDGFRTEVIDPRQNSTVTSYLAWDEPITAFPVRIDHPEEVRTLIGRDAFGKPLAITRRNNSGSQSVTRRYVYDAQELLCKTLEPETGATIVDYDGAGNLLWSVTGMALPGIGACNRTDVPSAARTTRTYDARNRILSLAFPDGQGSTTYSYYPDGALEEVTAWNGALGDVSTVYVYNNRGQVTGEAIGAGDHQWGIGYGYDQNGHLSKHILPSGDEIAYAPNALGQATRAGNYATDATYYPNGALERFVYGNGIVHKMTQNTRGLPSRSRDSYQTLSFHDDNLDYDANGNVIAISDGPEGARGNRDMTYDGLDRLVQVESTMFGTAVYRYDAIDNLSRVSVSGGTKPRDHTYVYDANQLLRSIVDTATSAANAQLDYDVQGNLSRKDGRSFEFDFGNRLRAVPGLEQYAYDGHGRRTQAVKDGTSIFSVYGVDGILRHLRNDREGTETSYVHLAGSLVAETERFLPRHPPTLMAPAYSATGAFTLAWTSAVGTTTYQLEERSGASAWQALQTSLTNTHTTSSRNPGIYLYRVRACQPVQTCGGWSNEAAVYVQVPPDEVPLVTAPPRVAIGAQYDVSWTATRGTVTYNLREQLKAAASTVYSGSNLTVTLPARTQENTYRYGARACNPAGCGPLSLQHDVLVTAVDPVTAAPTLSMPASSLTGEFTVSWSAVTSQRYELQQRFEVDAWSIVHSADAAQWAATGKVAGTWQYRVRACNSVGCGPYSGIASTLVTLPPEGAPALQVPLGDLTGSYEITWGTLAAATRFELDEKLDGGSWVNVYDGALRMHGRTGRPRGTHAYRVRGCNIADCAAYSAARAITVTLPPQTPASITSPVSNMTGKYQVSWAAMAFATSYRLEEQKGSDAWTEIYGKAASGFNVIGRAPGTHRYRARACNAAGCSAYSAIATTTVTAPPPPPVPQGLVVTSSGGSCELQWNSSAGAANYQVQPGDVVVTSPLLLIYGLCESAYRVMACNLGGCSDYSAYVGPGQQVTIPTAAPSVTAPANTQTGSYQVSWTSVARATSYGLEERVGSGSWSQIQSTAATNAALTGRQPGSHTYRVRGCNSAGCGPWSAVATVSVLPPSAAPPVPTGIVVQSGGGECVVYWNPSLGATYYDVDPGGYAEGTFFTVSLSQNCTSQHRVMACNDNGECSEYSPWVLPSATAPPSWEVE